MIEIKFQLTALRLMKGRPFSGKNKPSVEILKKILNEDLVLNSVHGIDVQSDYFKEKHTKAHFYKEMKRRYYKRS